MEKTNYLPPDCEAICVSTEMNIMSFVADIEDAGTEDRDW